MPTAFVNRIATATPPNDVHVKFVEYAAGQLAGDPRSARLFRRMSEMGGIEHRYSYLQAPDVLGDDDGLDVGGFYRRGAFPSTGARMRFFEQAAPPLAKQAVDRLLTPEEQRSITHVIVTSCTGMSAPGIDLQIAKLCNLSKGVERTMIGFMGCYAAMNALKMARHVVRSEPTARVLTINLELCTLHFQESTDLEQILSFYLFADGCAASLVTADEQGVALDRFHSVLAPETEGLITWNVGDSGFDMMLSGRVPNAIRDALCGNSADVLQGVPVDEIDLWAVHPGGKSVLDAVQGALDLPPDALAHSREVLRSYGNMSSPTVMFVLKSVMEAAKPGQKGCAMAFGPGLVAETLAFHTA